MGKALKIILSDWSIILIVSILLFVFWGGPVFTADSLSHGGRLIVSYTIIPIGVAVALLRRRQWSWTALTYYTLAIAIVKMVITMTIFLWVIPSGQRSQSREIGDVKQAVRVTPMYATAVIDHPATLAGQLPDEFVGKARILALEEVARGKATGKTTHVLTVVNSRVIPGFVGLLMGDKLSITNTDKEFHTFLLTGEEGQLFQLPLPPAKTVTRQVTHAGRFTSRCARGHEDESVTVLVFRHPYFVPVGGDGQYLLDSIPPGSYHIALWNEDESQPERVTQISIGPDERRALDWSDTPPETP